MTFQFPSLDRKIDAAKKRAEQAQREASREATPIMLQELTEARAALEVVCEERNELANELSAARHELHALYEVLQAERELQQPPLSMAPPGAGAHAAVDADELRAAIARAYKSPDLGVDGNEWSDRCHASGSCGSAAPHTQGSRHLPR